MYLFAGFDKDTVSHLKDLLMELRAEAASTHVHTEEAALKVLKEKAPCLIFLDMDHQQFAGVDLLKKIKEYQPLSDVIGISNNTSLMLKAFRNEVFDFIIKPIERSELATVIQRHQKVRLNPPGKNQPDLVDSLTSRQQEILRLALRGRSSKQIADSLFLSPNTVDTHRRNILRTMKCGSIMEVVGLYG